MIHELDGVVLTAAIPAEGPQPGDLGTVVHVYVDGAAFEVEFIALDGETAAAATIEVGAVPPVARNEICPARELRAS